MNINQKKKNFLFIVAVVVLTSLISFFLGRLSVLEQESGKVEIYYPEIVAELTEGQPAEEKVYASRSGTKYYFDWCTSQVKEENKIYFDTVEKAEATGRTLASGCTEY